VRAITEEKENQQKRLKIERKEVEAPDGFEPPHRSFAERLRPIVMEKYQDREER